MDETYILNLAITHPSNDTRSPPEQPPIQPISVASYGITASSARGSAAILALPHEILTQILAYILVSSDRKPIALHSRAGRRWKNEVLDLNALRNQYYNTPKVTKSDLLDILLVSRSFYFAGIAAFFGENVLQFENMQHLDRLTATLDLDRRRCIRHIALKTNVDTKLWDGGAGSEKLNVCFERLPALVTARVDCRWHAHGPWALDYWVPKFREAFEKLKERCGEKGEQVLRLELPNCTRDQMEMDLEDPDL